VSAFFAKAVAKAVGGPSPVAFWSVDHSTSTIISTSTALSKGSPAIPTAERAYLTIASPKTSAIRSENPFTTFDWSPKPYLPHTNGWAKFSAMSTSPTSWPSTVR
jgi:hypothetical protein